MINVFAKQKMSTKKKGLLLPEMFKNYCIVTTHTSSVMIILISIVDDYLRYHLYHSFKEGFVLRLTKPLS